jgi:hypothetical protein
MPKKLDQLWRIRKVLTRANARDLRLYLLTSHRPSGRVKGHRVHNRARFLLSSFIHPASMSGAVESVLICAEGKPHRFRYVRSIHAFAIQNSG